MLLQYNVSKMQELLKSFYLLTKIRIVVFDDAFHKISEYPEHDCGFCTLIRENPVAIEKCRISDRFACEQCKTDNKLHSYTCHAGLTETVAPIHHGNMIIGYIMFGQVLRCDDKETYWLSVWQKCQYYGVEHDRLRNKYNKKFPITIDAVYASAKILEACAGYLWLQRAISLQEDDLPQKIDDYIIENLSEDLSVSALCQQFGISRSGLYKIAKEYYGKGIEQVIRDLRINRSGDLLKNTDMSVSEVALQVGFPDYNYFIKLFKKKMDITPKQYSKLHSVKALQDYRKTRHL